MLPSRVLHQLPSSSRHALQRNVRCITNLPTLFPRSLKNAKVALSVGGNYRHYSSGEDGSMDRPMVRLSNSRVPGRQSMKIGSDHPLVKGKVTPSRPVPQGILKPPYADSGEAAQSHEVSKFDLDGEDLQKMRRACEYTAGILNYAGSLVSPGVTTEEIDAKVFEKVTGDGYYPSPVNYAGFPKALCSSVNEVICHGVPDDRPLREGDIVNLDVSCYIDGFHGDTSRTFLVGEVSEEARRLVEVTEETLDRCISICGPGVPLNEIGRVVDEMCEIHGYESSRTFAGHGIGATFHMQPFTLNFGNTMPGHMEPGMVFTIEPALCQGSQRHVIWDDGWTAVTADGGLSAQAEHTLLITLDGVEVLT